MRTLIGKGFPWSRRLLICALTLVTAGVLGGCGEKSGSAQSAAPPPPQVAISAPVRKKVQEWDEYTGRFAAVDRVEVRARVSGYLTEINFRDGQIVYKGDPLFVIDPRPFEAALAAARAEVQSAKAQLVLAQKELERALDLRRTQAVSQAILEQRQATVQGAQAQVLGAEAQVRTAELDVEFTRIVAPVTGRVSERVVSVGNLVSGGSAQSTLLTTIVSLDPIHFYFDADQNAFLRYVRLSKEGVRQSGRDVAHPVQLALPDEKGFPHSGRLEFIDNRLDESTGTIRARATVSNPDLLFTPGLFGRIRLVGRGEYEATLLPDSAIGTDQNRRFVYVIGEDRKPTYRGVTVGPIIDGLRVVRDGLKPEEKVVISGLQRIRPNAPVTPVEAPIQGQQAAVETVPGAGSAK